jgi:uncharacterized membrane protein required for colicin V production
MVIGVGVGSYLALGSLPKLPKFEVPLLSVPQPRTFPSIGTKPAAFRSTYYADCTHLEQQDPIMSLDALPFNAFDLLLVIILGVGIYQGRKEGMSVGIIPLFRWLCIVFLCALAYEPVGQFFNQSTTMFSSLSCYVISYVGTALIIVVLFIGIKRGLGGKLLGSDVFGSSEYYLGMGSGLIRYTCIIIAFLAVLNARLYSSVEIKARERYVNDMYGKDYFPGLQILQSAVFEKSLTGPWIKENLSFFLIKPTAPEDKSLHQKEAKWN